MKIISNKILHLNITKFFLILNIFIANLWFSTNGLARGNIDIYGGIRCYTAYEHEDPLSYFEHLVFIDITNISDIMNVDSSELKKWTSGFYCIDKEFGNKASPGFISDYNHVEMSITDGKLDSLRLKQGTYNIRDIPFKKGNVNGVAVRYIGSTTPEPYENLRYANGTGTIKRYERIYKNNILYEARDYYDDGKISIEAKFKNGKLSSYKKYDKDGQVVLDNSYDN